MQRTYNYFLLFQKGPCRIPTFGSRIPQIQPTAAASAHENIGKRVRVGEKEGILRYVGNVCFSKGTWCGVELSAPIGKNDGTVNGVRYFSCSDRCGLMAPLSKIAIVEGSCESLSDNSSGPYSMLFIDPKSTKNAYPLARTVSQEIISNGTFSRKPKESTFTRPLKYNSKSNDVNNLTYHNKQICLQDRTYDCEKNVNDTIVVKRDGTFDLGQQNSTQIIRTESNSTYVRSEEQGSRNKLTDANKKRSNQTFESPGLNITAEQILKEKQRGDINLTFTPFEIPGNISKEPSLEVKRRKTSNLGAQKNDSVIAEKEATYSVKTKSETAVKPSSLPQLKSVSPTTPVVPQKFTFSTPVHAEFREPFTSKARISSIHADDSSKRDSLEFDESLGILTPDQMKDGSQFPVVKTRSPSLNDVNLVDCLKGGMKSELASPRDESLGILDGKLMKGEPIIQMASKTEEPATNELGIENKQSLSNLILKFKTPKIEIPISTELKDLPVQDVPSPNLTDYSFGIIDEQILSNFTLKTDTTMNMELPLDSLDKTTLNRLEQTPSPEELPLDPMPLVESDPKTEPTKSKTSNSFITSITSITSLDTGYQGDGEMSRPASRGADNSPLTRRPLPRPQVRRPDPMTDSDFYTESDADNHEDNHQRGDRKAQVIDGTLYGVDPQAAADIYVNNKENMDSSGIFTDIESNTRNEEVLEVPDASPSDSSSKTISENSQDNIQEVLDKTIESKEVEKIKDNPKKRNAPSPGISSPSSFSSPRHGKEENAAKKYKMPKRDVASKVKAMLEPSRNQAIEKKLVKKPAGRWDAVMNKISKNDQSKTNLKEVKSKVFSEVNVNTGIGQRHGDARKTPSRTVGNQKSSNNKICTTPVKRPGSSQSLPSSEKRRIRNRPNSGTPSKAIGGNNIESSIHSSLSDLSAATLPPSNKISVWFF
ncbi:hypothetical protein JTB14_018035 [Gonioctena quinquepunctata]|nr:hypothetical protein JTB14_018035 [Gonioctena quinquepunctata]